MKAIDNFDAVEAPQEYKRLSAGGYVCRITNVEDVADREYLKIEYDIADGAFKGYWSDMAERNGWWGGDFIRSYKEKAAGFFKQFIGCVEQSNVGYVWKWDEQTLKGKLIGVVLGEEEYEKRGGGIGTRLRVSKTLPIEEIRNGNYSIPAKKTIVVIKPSVDVAVTDDDLPFDF